METKGCRRAKARGSPKIKEVLLLQCRSVGSFARYRGSSGKLDNEDQSNLNLATGTGAKTDGILASSNTMENS